VTTSRLFLVFVGSGVGGVLRLLLAAGVQARAGPSFPWGTLAVNVAGGLVLGVLLGVFGASSIIRTEKLLEMSGDLPVLVEAVDARERIEAVLPALEELIRDCGSS
jgi:fluoride ion exporter CrcB/FEX